MSVQNFSYISSPDVSGKWDLYLKVPPQPNVSVSWPSGKAVAPTPIYFKQNGNVLWIPNLGRGGMGYVTNHEIHFSYLVVENNVFLYYSFVGTFSNDDKSMSGRFVIRAYRSIVKGNWTATKSKGSEMK